MNVMNHQFYSVWLFLLLLQITVVSLLAQSDWDHNTFLGNCPPTPPLSQHFVLSEK